MKSLIVLAILAVACGYGLYTQYTGKQKQIADAENRIAIAGSEAAKLRPRLDAARERFAKCKSEADDISTNLPKTASEEALKAEAAKLEAARAEMEAELARTVPDPPLPAAQAATIEAAQKRLDELKVEIPKLTNRNAVLRRYYAEEMGMVPKAKTKTTATR